MKECSNHTTVGDPATQVSLTGDLRGLTSVARRISTSAQPYYLMYYMKGRNKVIRLECVGRLIATEVVFFDIRSKIRYGATTADIPVETRFIASLQSQTASVETQDFASHLINKTTSVARRMSTPMLPYYLIYYMKGTNKGIRLECVGRFIATEVVSFDIRSKIRYAITISLRITNEEM